MLNSELCLKLYEVTGIKSNVFNYIQVDKYGGEYYKDIQELKLDSKVIIFAKGESFDFEFKLKTPKKEINLAWLIKAIQSEYKKHEKYMFKNFGMEVQPFEKVIKYKLTYHLYYVTEYGIGIEVCFLGGDKQKELKRKLSTFLEKEKVTYQNEYSDAFWVYRYKISNDYHLHNTLLERFRENFDTL